MPNPRESEREREGERERKEGKRGLAETHFDPGYRKSRIVVDLGIESIAVPDESSGDEDKTTFACVYLKQWFSSTCLQGYKDEDF